LKDNFKNIDAVLIDPFNRQTVSQDSLLELLSVLPGHIIVPLEDRVALCSKFFDYHALDPGSVPAYEIGDRVNAFWVAIQRLQDPDTGKQLRRHEHLCKHSLACPSLPLPS
jgi:hypothetical protein